MFLPKALLNLAAGMILWMTCLSNSVYAQTPLLDSLTKLLEQTREDTNRVLVMRSIAVAYFNTTPAKARNYAIQFKALSEKLGFAKGIALAYDAEGNILRFEGNYTGAVAKHFQALRIYDSIGYKTGFRNTSSNIGTDYFYLKNYDKALQYYTQSLNLTDTSDHPQLIKIYNNLAMVYSFTRQPRKAIEVYLKALPIADDDKTYSTHAKLYSGIATAYARLDDFGTAMSYMHKALYYEQLTGDKAGYAGSSCTIAGFYIELGKFDKAHFHLADAYKIATETNALPTLVIYYRNLAHLYFRQKHFEDAYNTLARYTELNDSLISKEYITQLAEMESQYQVDVKNKELELLGKEKSLHESELQRQKQWRFTLTGILALVLILLFLTYRNVQLKKKTNRLLKLENQITEDAKKDLERQNTLLHHETVLAQYETLKSQVNPHFLFNSLNALSSLIKTDTEKAQQFTSVFSRLYRSVLELKNHTVITLAEELQLADDYIYLQKIRFGESLHIEKHIQATKMNMYLPPFCLQMLIENAIKHNIVSAEKPLHISIRSVDKSIVISNNIQRRVIRDESTGTGIRNIIERFKILSECVPEFCVVNEKYIATIPLIAEQL